MTLKKFKKELERLIESEETFVVHTVSEMPELSENQFVVAGENESEVFTFEIVKVI